MALMKDRTDDRDFANAVINFVQATLERFKHETDVVVLALRLVSEIMPSLVLFKLQVGSF